MIKLNDPRITAYLLGELDPAEVEVIEQALRSSPTLAKNVEQMRQTIELLKLALPEDSLSVSPVNVNQTANEKPEFAQTEKAPSTFWGIEKRWSVFFLEVAAVLAIGVGLYYLLHPGTESDVSSQLSTQTNDAEIEVEPQVSFAPFTPSQQNSASIENTWEEYGLSSQQIEELSQVSDSSDVPEMDSSALFPSESVDRTERIKANLELYSPDGWIAQAYGAAAVKTDFSNKLIVENPVEYTNVKPKSSFGLSSQDASWHAFHRAITQSNSLPSPQSVRVEQYVNHFRYSLPQPGADAGAISVSVQLGRHPWAPGMILAKIGFRGQSGDAEKIVARNALAEVSFNPEQIKAYRLIGYEKLLTTGNLASSQPVLSKDIAANSEIVVLYELALANPSDAAASPANNDNPPLWFSVDVEYMDAQTEAPIHKTVYTYPQSDSVLEQSAHDPDFQFAAAVALFAQILQKSEYCGTGTFDTVSQLIKDSIGEDEQRKEFANLVDKAMEISNKQERQ